LNGKCYVGSSVDLSRRFSGYYSLEFLKREIKKSKSIILRSLLKHGYSAFSLEILEYCSPSEAIAREQYYLDLLNPECNILRNAGSLLGYKHPEGSKTKN
jgi:group I intron endonuclease